MRSEPDLAGIRVLVVDDDDDVVVICRLALGTRGAVTTGARDAAEARTQLDTGDFDVVVTDLVMPGLTGRRFLDWIEQTHPAMPVVVMSGVPDQVQAAATCGPSSTSPSTPRRCSRRSPPPAPRPPAERYEASTYSAYDFRTLLTFGRATARQ